LLANVRAREADPTPFSADVRRNWPVGQGVIRVGPPAALGS
jgi:hypothetical protein